MVLFRERTESGESCIYSTRTHQPGQLGMRPVDSCRSNHRRSFTGPMPNTHLGLRALVPATFSKHRKARIYLLGQPPAALQHQNGFLGPHSLSVASRASSGPKAWNGCVGPHQITIPHGPDTHTIGFVSQKSGSLGFPAAKLVSVVAVFSLLPSSSGFPSKLLDTMGLQIAQGSGIVESARKLPLQAITRRKGTCAG